MATPPKVPQHICANRAPTREQVAAEQARCRQLISDTPEHRLALELLLGSSPADDGRNKVTQGNKLPFRARIDR